MPIRVHNLHSWNLTYKGAVDVQRRLQSGLILTPLEKTVRFVGGADVSYAKKERSHLFGAIVVIDIEKMEVIEAVTEEGEADFRYIPGLLSFREIPVLLKALERIRRVPEVFVLDGQGIAHPRGLGLASHFGLLTDVPSIGCAKSRLVGKHKLGPKRRGAFSYLYFHERKVGAAVCTKDKTNPVFVSPGHRVDIASSINVILSSCHGYRLPEPIRQAHALATSCRVKEASEEKGRNDTCVSAKPK
jgi:deoxyribonuclease V